MSNVPMLPIKNSRLTVARELILNCFLQYKKPIDYNQIAYFLNDKGVNVNKTTIYRQLDYLKENQIIHEVDFGEGKKRYEINSKHHHHLLCTICSKVECIDFTEDFKPQLAEISKTTNFKITGHMLEFLGVCEDCQNRKAKSANV